MIFDIIMMASLYPIIFILYYMLVNEVEPKKNIILGVTLSYHARNNEELLGICKEYKKNLRIVTILLLPIPLCSFLIEAMSFKFLLYMIWMIVVLVAPYVIYGLYHIRIKKLKQIYGWKSEYSLQEGTAVDMKVAAISLPRLKMWWFIPSILICIIPVIMTIVKDREKEEYFIMLILYLSNFAITMSFVIFHRLIYRQRAEIIDDNTSLTIALTRVRRYHWSKCMMVSACLTGIFSFLMWLFMNNENLVLIIVMVYAFLLTFFLVRVEFVIRAIQHKLTEGSGEQYYLDDDVHWILGMLYYNENDKHLMINNRVGMGTTMNLAKTAGKIIMAFSLICVLALPLIGVWMIKEEFTPLQFQLTENQLLVSHTSQLLKLDRSDIISATLLEDLPSSNKVVGTNFEYLWKGKFRLGDMGVYQVYLNPKEGPYIVIETQERNYVIGGSHQVTMELYDALVARTIGK